MCRRKNMFPKVRRTSPLMVGENNVVCLLLPTTAANFGYLEFRPDLAGFFLSTALLNFFLNLCIWSETDPSFVS